MILEGIVTTLNRSNELNVAPMGPIVNESMTRLLLRPFQSSTTYENLKASGYGVFHVVDDVLLIARAALDRLEQAPPTFNAIKIEGRVLSDCCRWYEFVVTEIDDSKERTEITAEVIHAGRVRDLFGFNRGKHAVLEATILATRLHLIPENDVRLQLTPLASAVEKTGGAQERTAFELVVDYINDWYRHEALHKKRD